MEPDPYLIEKDVPFGLYVEEALESYLVWRKQAIDVHWVLGTQRLLELKTGMNVSRRRADSLLTQYLE
jgi:hypothetical protein